MIARMEQTRSGDYYNPLRWIKNFVSRLRTGSNNHIAASELEQERESHERLLGGTIYYFSLSPQERAILSVLKRTCSGNWDKYLTNRYGLNVEQLLKSSVSELTEEQQAIRNLVGYDADQPAGQRTTLLEIEEIVQQYSRQYLKQ